MKDYPKMFDKVILREDFKGSDEYNEYFWQGRIDPLLGKVCTVRGMLDFREDDRTVAITLDGDVLFKVGLQWAEANPSEEKE